MINQKHLIVICLAATSSNFILLFPSGLVMFASHLMSAEVRTHTGILCLRPGFVLSDSAIYGVDVG